MIKELKDKAQSKMADVINFLAKDLGGISTGRANPDLLEPVKVEAYGSLMPITQVASLSTPDSTTIAVQVWDKGMVKAVEKAIVNSNLGFNPMVDGQLLRMAVPKLSEQRRVELVKLAKKYGEDKKVVLRNVRRDILDEFKKREKEEGISKDQAHDFSDEIQQITDNYVKEIDEKVAVKEKDLMTI